MPPKAKFTQEEIIEAALNIVRTNGYEALTSRALGTYLSSSARPIFTVFKNMEEVQQAMIEAAKTLYKEYVNKGLKEEHPFKGATGECVRSIFTNIFFFLLMSQNFFSSSL